MTEKIEPYGYEDESIYSYLNIDPLKDYWYSDVDKGVWYVHRGDGTFSEKPIRPIDYKREEQELARRQKIIDALYGKD